VNADLERQAEECAASIKRLDGEVSAAIARRDFTTADKLDRQRSKLQRMLASHHEAKAASYAATLARTGNTNCRGYVTQHNAAAARLRAEAKS
jgi:hypothetical protein